MFGVLAAEAGLPKCFRQQRKAPVLLQVMRKDIISNEEPVGMISGSWGVVTGPDNKNWYFTQDINQMFTRSTVTIYNPYCQQQASFDVVPDFPEGVTVESIQPYGTLTTDFFDNDASTMEMTIFIHGYRHPENTNVYEQFYELAAYRMDGEKVWSTTDANNAIFFDAGNGYKRFVLIEPERVAPEVTGSNEPFDLFRVMRPAADGSGIAEEHLFKVKSEQFYYAEGPEFSTYVIGGKPYYTLQHFDKIYATLPTDDQVGEDGQISDEDIIVTPDNKFRIEVWDGTDYSNVANLSLGTEAPEGFLYRFPSFSMFSYKDLSKGYFTLDDKFNFIVTYYDYSIALDDVMASYAAYSEDGTELLQICDNVVMANKLSDIPGYEDQYLFLRQLPETQELVTINLPSGEDVTTFGATAGSVTEGMMQASTSIDRFPVGNAYQYCMGMNEGRIDDDGRIVTYYGWFRTDGELDHWVSSPLSSGIETVAFWVSDVTLDPHLFFSDDQHEYLQLAKQRGADASIEDVLYITNDAGDIRYQLGDNPELGNLRQISVIGEGDNRQLLIGYWGYDETNFRTTYDLVLFDLPLDGEHDTDAIKSLTNSEWHAPMLLNKSFDLAGRQLSSRSNTNSSMPNIRIINGKKYLSK